MPELPEVETIRNGLAPILTGKTIARVELRRKDLRIPFPADMRERLEGTVIEGIRRRSKYLLIHVIPAKAGIHLSPNSSGATMDSRPKVYPREGGGGNDGLVLIIHLGMSGRVLLETTGYTPKKHDHVVLTFSDDSILVYNDARRFGLMTLCETAGLDSHPLLIHLGPEPFSDAFTPEYLQAVLKQRSAPIKHIIMDASVVVGVGNIYASESLFRTGIHPARKASSLSAKEAGALVITVRQVLREAIDSGGSTLRDYVRSDGDLGYFQHQFRVYGRENKPCVTCGTSIERVQQQGRSSFYCPRCQRK